MPVPCSAVCKLQYAVFGMDEKYSGTGRDDDEQHGDTDERGFLPQLHFSVPPIGSRV